MGMYQCKYYQLARLLHPCWVLLSCDMSCDHQVTDLLGQELVVNTSGNGVGQVEVQLEYQVANDSSQQDRNFNIETTVTEYTPGPINDGDVDCGRYE